MTVASKTLIEAKFASNSQTTEFTVSSGKKVIIDKFTATNTDSSSRTLTVNLVEPAGTAAASNVVTSALSIAAGASVDLPEMKNHVLESTALISCIASVAAKVVIRASGREIT